MIDEAIISQEPQKQSQKSNKNRDLVKYQAETNDKFQSLEDEKNTPFD
jgi:hypothetical protein